jgi:hypothetical protein
LVLVRSSGTADDIYMMIILVVGNYLVIEVAGVARVVGQK